MPLKNLSLSENVIRRGEELARYYGTTFSGIVTKALNDAWEKHIRDNPPKAKRKPSPKNPSQHEQVLVMPAPQKKPSN